MSSYPAPPAPAGAPAPWGRAPVPVPTVFAYHRLLRAQPDYRWWRPLVAVAVAGAAILATNVSISIMLVVAVGAERGFDALLDPTIAADAILDAGSPLSLLLGLGSVAVWLPCVFLGCVVAGIRPLGALHSVAGRFRWRWLLSCLWPAFAIVGVTILVTAVILPLAFGETLYPPSVPAGTLLLSVLVILLLVPFQAAAEEYVFRGLLMQALGSWVAFPLLALVLPTLLFTLGHLYDIWGLIDVAIFGLVAAWLTWRTGGLEAAIALHVANNVVVFLVLASGVGGGTAVTSETGGPLALIPSVLMEGAYVALVLWQGRRARLATTASGVMWRWR